MKKPCPFFQAMACTPPVIFGRRLKPFSLSHSMILNGLDNGWLSGDYSRTGFLHAVWICLHDHEENVRYIDRPPVIKMAWLAFTAKRYNWIEEQAGFMRYLSDYTRVPPHWESGATGNGFRAPWQYHFVMVACERFGLTNSDAWNMPVSLARCYYDTWAESKGDASLVSQDQRKLMDAEGIEYE